MKYVLKYKIFCAADTGELEKKINKYIKQDYEVDSWDINNQVVCVFMTKAVPVKDKKISTNN